MIQFFRRIRQQLLNENKLSKYLTYAIGEIILVVIGIIIAIQLNNWNEQRISDNQLQITLTKLKNDLELDYRKLDSLEVLYADWYHQSNMILDSVLGGKLNKLNNINQYEVGRGSMNYLSINRSTYNELINTKDHSGLANTEIGQLITEYFEYAEIELTKVNSDNLSMINYIINRMNTHEDNRYFRLLNQRNLESIDWSWLKDPSSEEYMLLENRTSFIQLAIIANTETIKDLKEKSIKLFNELDSWLSTN